MRARRVAVAWDLGGLHRARARLLPVFACLFEVWESTSTSAALRLPSPSAELLPAAEEVERRPELPKAEGAVSRPAAAVEEVAVARPYLSGPRVPTRRSTPLAVLIAPRTGLPSKGRWL